VQRRPIAANARRSAGLLFSGDLMKTRFGRIAYVIKMIAIQLLYCCEPVLALIKYNVIDMVITFLPERQECKA
jgi:hypothetical protein